MLLELGHWTAWVIFAAYLVVTWFVAALARWVTRGIVRRVVARTNTTLDDQLVQAAVRPVRILVLIGGLRLALEALSDRLPLLAQAPEFAWVEKGLGVVIALAVAGIVNGVLRTALDWYVHELAADNSSTWNEELLPVIRRVLSLVVYFIAISIILKDFGKDITALVTTAGIASLAVALAAQETLSNMLGGLVILVDRPFRVGDAIELSDGKSGEVAEIGLRSTRIKLGDGNSLVVPNKDMAGSRIINLALPNQRAALRITLHISHDADVDAAKTALLAVLAAHPDVLREPEPGVWLTQIGERNLEVLITCWVDSYRLRTRVTDELNRQFLKALPKAGVTIAYPEQFIRLHSQEGGE